MSENKKCKFPTLHLNQCHNCPEFRARYFLKRLNCDYILQPKIAELLDKKAALLRQLSPHIEKTTNSTSRIYRIKNKEVFGRISAEIREIESLINSLQISSS
jgi:hypothetical protein